MSYSIREMGTPDHNALDLPTERKGALCEFFSTTHNMVSHLILYSLRKIVEIARRIFYGKNSLHYLLPHAKELKNQEGLTSYICLEQGILTKGKKLFIDHTHSYTFPLENGEELSLFLQNTRDSNRVDVAYGTPTSKLTLLKNLPVYRTAYHLSLLFLGMKEIREEGWESDRQYSLLRDRDIELPLFFSLSEDLPTAIRDNKMGPYFVHFSIQKRYKQNKVDVHMEIYDKGSKQLLFDRHFYPLTIHLDPLPLRKVSPKKDKYNSQ